MSDGRQAPAQASGLCRDPRGHRRWADNDIDGHAGNVVYYSYFDATVSVWLIEAGLSACLARRRPRMHRSSRSASLWRRNAAISHRLRSRGR